MQLPPNKINLLLDATLGLINIEQTNIIKIFSVLAIVFLPPTLIASIYGMNFAMHARAAPALGYPFAMLLMVLSAILPYLFCKGAGGSDARRPSRAAPAGLRRSEVVPDGCAGCIRRDVETRRRRR